MFGLEWADNQETGWQFKLNDIATKQEGGTENNTAT